MQAKAMAESKLADFEKEKMMIELDVKETIARHKTEVTERMAWAAKVCCGGHNIDLVDLSNLSCIIHNYFNVLTLQ